MASERRAASPAAAPLSAAAPPPAAAPLSAAAPLPAAAPPPAAPPDHPGCLEYTGGQVALTGSLLDLFARIDDLFRGWARESGAREFLFPAFIPVRELAKLDYFRSFPHLVTFPAALDPDPASLARFVRDAPGPGAAAGGNGTVRLGELAPIGEVLTPAACYHFYVRFQGETLDRARIVTTRATCFRREAHFAPLERQWSFSMREIVCIGSREEVTGFLAGYRARLTAFFGAIGLPIEWQEATDPFFDPTRNPKYLMQKVDPVKTEMVFDGRLAIGSINFHHDTFGQAFQIRRAGEAAYSGCVAFGLERWVYAWLHRFGGREESWPALPVAPESRPDARAASSGAASAGGRRPSAGRTARGRRPPRGRRAG